MDVESVLTQMLSAGQAAFGEGWDVIKVFAPAEFRKIALQLVDIADNLAKFALDPAQGYSPETGKLLLQMQRNATESVLVALTELTLLTVQNALNAILQALRNAFVELIGLL